MSIDLSKLTPAPWRVAQDQLGHWRILWPHSDRSSVVRNGKVFDEDDAAFIALARNAFGVMMRRGWYPRHYDEPGNQWGIWSHGWVASALSNQRWQDPFTALVEADAWYKEYVEKAPASPTTP